MQSIHMKDIAELKDTDRIDVRSIEEFQKDALPNSINIPIDTFEHAIPTLLAHTSLVIYCALGGRASIAARMLAPHYDGILYVVDRGGVPEWKK